MRPNVRIFRGLKQVIRWIKWENERRRIIWNVWKLVAVVAWKPDLQIVDRANWTLYLSISPRHEEKRLTRCLIFHVLFLLNQPLKLSQRGQRERERLPLFLFFSLLFHKVTLPFSTYTYRLLIKPLNALSKRRIDRNKPERIVFPSFCIHSIHFTFHRKYRRAIIFEKTFPLQKNSTPSRIIRVENQARMT